MTTNILHRNNVKVLGSGSQYIIFAPGFGCDQNMWRFVYPSFMQSYRIVLFDYVGSGRSDITAYSEARYSSLDGYAQDVLDICEALEIESALFVGHSVGGMIGVLASIREPHRFAQLLLVSPSPCYLNDPPSYHGGFDRSELQGLMDLMDKNYIGWAEFLAPKVMQNREHPELTRELEESFCSTDPVIAKRFATATFFSDNRKDLSFVAVPSLIIQCSDDLIAPVQVGEFMNRTLPRSSLRILEASGHCPHMSHPDETVELLLDYLGRTEDAT